MMGPTWFAIGNIYFLYMYILIHELTVFKDMQLVVILVLFYFLFIFWLFFLAYKVIRGLK